jgi:hypothetical protein
MRNDDSVLGGVKSLAALVARDFLENAAKIQSRPRMRIFLMDFIRKQPTQGKGSRVLLSWPSG